MDQNFYCVNVGDCMDKCETQCSQCSGIPEVKTYTQEEVIQLLIKERERAIDIAYDFMKEHNKTFEFRKISGSPIAFVSGNAAEACRLVGNAISGLNAISVTLGETVESEIRKQFKK